MTAALEQIARGDHGYESEESADPVTHTGDYAIQVNGRSFGLSLAQHPGLQGVLDVMEELRNGAPARQWSEDEVDQIARSLIEAASRL